MSGRPDARCRWPWAATVAYTSTTLRQPKGHDLTGWSTHSLWPAPHWRHDCARPSRACAILVAGVAPGSMLASTASSLAAMARVTSRPTVSNASTSLVWFPVTQAYSYPNDGLARRLGLNWPLIRVDQWSMFQLIKIYASSSFQFSIILKMMTFMIHFQYYYDI